MNKKYDNKKKAFTLAEVLITLAVIGVVAAMTLPTLIKNYQKHVWYNQFRKAASQLENAIKMYEVDNGCIGNILDCKNYFGTSDFVKYFNIVEKIDSNNQEKYYEIYDNKNISWYCYYYSPCAFITNDGMLFNFNTDDGFANGGIVDINGPNKGPNQYGRDIFVFYAPARDLGWNDKKPLKNILWAGNEYLYASEVTEKTSSPCDNNEKYGCAARLLREGKMDY